MSALLEQLKRDKQRAFKDKETIENNLLSVVIAEAERTQKIKHSISDKEVEKIMFKFVKNIKENINYAEKIGSDSLNQFKQEVAILEVYLPKQLSKEELEKVLKHIADNMPNPNIGLIMKSLKENYVGMYDGKEASKIIKDLL